MSTIVRFLYGVVVLLFFARCHSKIDLSPMERSKKIILCFVAVFLLEEYNYQLKTT
jgi:hypothetical protein